VAAAAREATRTAATSTATTTGTTTTATTPPAATGDPVWARHGSNVLSESQGRPRGQRRHGQHTGHDETKSGELLHGFTKAQASS
jgi:hypothetical protein